MINVSSKLNTLRWFVALELRRYTLKVPSILNLKVSDFTFRMFKWLSARRCNNGLRKGLYPTTLILSSSETCFQKDDSDLCRSFF